MSVIILSQRLTFVDMLESREITNQTDVKGKAEMTRGLRLEKKSVEDLETLSASKKHSQSLGGEKRRRGLP